MLIALTSYNLNTDGLECSHLGQNYLWDIHSLHGLSHTDPGLPQPQRDSFNNLITGLREHYDRLSVQSHPFLKINYMCMSLCACAHECRCLQGPIEGTGSPRARFTGSSEPFTVSAGNWTPAPLEVQYVTPIFEPSPQSSFLHSYLKTEQTNNNIFFITNCLFHT